MSSILPPEVVLMVMQHLHTSPDPEDARALTNALCTCSTWRDIGMDVLWTDIVLDSPESMQSLCDAPASSGLIRTRSLTVTFPEQWFLYEDFGPGRGIVYHVSPTTYCMEASEATQGVHQALRALSQRLPAMSGLETFSFRIQAPIITARRPNSPMEWPRGFFIPHDIVHGVIQSLPPSVRHLELDTRGADRICEGRMDLDVCAALADRLQGLTSLRLRMQRICPQLFRPSTSLRSLIINTIDIACVTLTYSCQDVVPEKDRFHPVLYWKDRHTRRGHSTRAELVRALQSFLPDLPNLQKCLVVDAERFRYGRRSVGMLHVRDFIGNLTTTFPIFDVNGPHGPRGWQILRIPAEQGDSHDIAGGIARLEDIAEGRQWQSTMSGLRLPTSLKDSSEGRRHAWVRNQDASFPAASTEIKMLHADEAVGPFLTKREFIELIKNESVASDGIWGVEVWSHEDEAGRLLVNVRVSEGVDDVEPLLRDEYEGDDEHGDSDEEDDESDEESTEFYDTSDGEYDISDEEGGEEGGEEREEDSDRVSD
ncbi:uncharacterized protein AB675_6748 [Cyphellophora attinorum]|uniref:F-box domain-containing protein n=1 Tax=Cyphellophora attinorum TaxID=1664694 RepID=A0A0N0NQ06_9EURO|nr:uncharacterized protein AB675_6748 [Phialophora attinorum]KPI43348.1 hypothetical protein AB675_6748 [Phialophora attinorum]